jgi:peptidoglycan/xylan/chitin deacetylase (PgdA/CDA1 family)/glycosyltransferase involved in cell wall biosynthesis
VRICIVNHARPSLNPRTVKEADALASAGHDVVVVGVAYGRAEEDREARVLASHPWARRTVSYARDDWRGFLRWFGSGLVSRVSERLAHAFGSHLLAEWAFVRYGPGLRSLAVAERADVYIAHNLQNLPVAARAAAEVGATLGFDVEDYHLDEDASDPAWLSTLKTRLMLTYLRRCRHVTAPSEAMADSLAQALAIECPTVVRNAFPKALRRGLTPPRLRTRLLDSADVSAYWFSQVISMDRGLQDFINAMPQLATRTSLHLRGRCSESVRRALLGLASSVGMQDAIHFHEPIDPDDLVEDAARHDFGLALEQPINRNKELTTSNKLFIYLLAGIVPVATKTKGQMEVMEKLAGDGVVYEAGEVGSLADGLNRFLGDSERLNRAKVRSWELATEQFCWENEAEMLREAVERGHGARQTATLQPDIPILMYHNLEDSTKHSREPFSLPVDLFQRHLEILALHGFETISFPDLHSVLRGEKAYTGREVLITFDDGYESFQRLAVPALTGMRMTATVFVVVGELGGTNRWDSERGQGVRTLMDADDLRRVRRAGMDVGVHGWSHRDLMACSAMEREFEILSSKQTLERILDVPARTFCYPYGRYAASLFGDLARAGYEGAVAMFSDEPRVTSNPFVMRRIYVHRGDHALRFRMKLSRPYLRYMAWRGLPADRLGSCPA